MDKQAYYQTLAQVMPVIVLAGGVELRHLVKRCSRPGGTFDKRHPLKVRVIAHLYVRALALANFLTLLLTLSCAHAVLTGDYDDWWLREILPLAWPTAAVLIGLPFVGAVLSPTDLLRWYGDTVPESERDESLS